jgi:hypothetical protein
LLALLVPYITVNSNPPKNKNKNKNNFLFLFLFFYKRRDPRSKIRTTSHNFLFFLKVSLFMQRAGFGIVYCTDGL